MIALSPSIVLLLCPQSLKTTQVCTHYQTMWLDGDWIVFSHSFPFQCRRPPPSLEGEIREMIEIYEEKGMSHEDAKQVILTMAKYRDFFVDVMMTQELELQVPDDDHVRESFNEGASCHVATVLLAEASDLLKECDSILINAGIVMFLSFAIFGAFPILGYVIFPSAFPEATSNQLFGAACGVTGAVLFFLGSLKSKFGYVSGCWYVAEACPCS